MAKTAQFPLTVSEGSLAVKIYRGRNRGRPFFTLVYSVGGKRERRAFAELEAARSEARVVLTKLANGETAVLELRNADRESYLQSLEALRGVNIGLLSAVREYRAAIDHLGGRATLNEAVRSFVASGAAEIKPCPPSLIVEHMLEAKKADGVSAVHLRDLRLRLDRFAKAFSQPIGEIDAKEINAWLRELNTGPRNRNNFAASITTLFRYARAEGHLPRDRATAADGLQRAKAVDGEIQIFTPEEIQRMLTRLRRERPDLLPYAAIGAFAGLRTAELGRLNWEDVKLDESHIVISAKKAKTAARRLVAIQPNLGEWLAPYRQEKGSVTHFVREAFLVKRTVSGTRARKDGSTEDGVTWKPNGLRHSFGSYRLAACKSAAEVALEMGNSPRILMTNYRELVTPAAAAKYWAIVPPASLQPK